MIQKIVNALPLAFGLFASTSLPYKALGCAAFTIIASLVSQKFDRDAEMFAREHATPEEIAGYIRYLTRVPLFNHLSVSKPGSKFQKLVLNVKYGSVATIKNKIVYFVKKYEEINKEKRFAVGIGEKDFEIINSADRRELLNRFDAAMKRHPFDYHYLFGCNGVFMDPTVESDNFFFSFPDKTTAPTVTTVAREKILAYQSERDTERKQHKLIELIDDAMKGKRYRILPIEPEKSDEEVKKISIAKLQAGLANLRVPKFETSVADDEYIIVSAQSESLREQQRNFAF